MKTKHKITALAGVCMSMLLSVSAAYAVDYPTNPQSFAVGTTQINPDTYYLYTDNSLTTNNASQDKFNLYYNSKNGVLTLNNA